MAFSVQAHHSGGWCWEPACSGAFRGLSFAGRVRQKCLNLIKKESGALKKKKKKKSAFWSFGSQIATSISCCRFCAGHEVTDEGGLFSRLISFSSTLGLPSRICFTQIFQKKTEAVLKNYWKKKLLMVLLGKMAAVCLDWKWRGGSTV